MTEQQTPFFLKKFLHYYKIYPNVPDPVYSTDNAACFDVFCHWEPGQTIKAFSENNFPYEFTTDDHIDIHPGHRYLVPTGLIFDIPAGHSVRLHPRSGNALKLGVIIANCEGVVDDDYYHETYAILYTLSQHVVCIPNNSRVMQGELIVANQCHLTCTKTQPTQKTNRTGGLGSTGVS